MNKPNLGLTPKTFEKVFSEWCKIINRRDCGSIIHLPKRDQLYRINAFIQSEFILRKHLKDYTKTQIISLDLASQTIDDQDDLEKFINTKISLKNIVIVLLILDADKLINEKISLASALNSLYHQLPTLSILYFFGNNITYPEIAKKLSSNTTIYQNIQIFPYLSCKDSDYFIRYLGKKFSVNLSENLIKEIINKCGGIAWLIKEVIREYSKTKSPKHIFDHDELKTKISILIDEFTFQEKQVLEKIIKKKYFFNSQEKKIIKYFLQTNTLIKNNDFYCLTSSLLESHFQKQLAEKYTMEIVNERDLYINGVMMNNYFSKREKRLLIFFVNNKGVPIARDSASKVIWSKDSYTDWALDQFMKRLRNKLISLGFEKNFIKTIKNQGFILN
jgi:hypothetical protein